MSRLSVFTVTRKRRRRSRSIGCSSIEATAPVCTFEVGHISSGTRRSRTKAASRPERDAPVVVDGDVVDDPHAVAQALGAAQLQRLPDRRQAEAFAGVDGEVEVLRAISWNASRWRVGGIARLRPAMSKPTTPASRWRTASSAISTERAAGAWR